MADIALIRQLLAAAHETGAPDYIDDAWNEREFTTPNGWKVVLFYDCGELDYIDHFVSPDGERMWLWGDELDPRLDDGGLDAWSTLQCWRGLDDTERLLAGL